MTKFNFSKRSKISKFFIFISLFFLLSFSFLSKQNPTFTFYGKNLRKLGIEKVFSIIFTIFSIFNYFFYLFFIIAFCYAPWLYMCVRQEEPNNNEEEARKISFFVNKIFYIINVGYIFTSGVNLFNDVEYRYSLSIFICALFYLIISSTIYIIISANCKDFCFPGICQWGYLKLMFTAPCCFFLPCKEEELKKCFNSEECKGGDCCKVCCCIGCLSCLGGILYITNVILYYLGLLLYSLFWLIGKFFVFISCNDCWLKEDYDMDSFSFTKTSNKRLVDSEEAKEVKKKVDKIITKKEKKQLKKISKNIFNRFGKTIKETIKKAEESEESEEK